MTITMYGAQWCGDCRRAKQYFDDNDIEFTYVNLEETPEAADIVLERNGGLKRVPVIVFGDDSHLTEPSNEALAAKLAELETGTCAVENFKVTKDEANGVFSLTRDGEIVSQASFTNRGNNSIVIPHVGTNPQHRGQGYAGRLMAGLLDIVREDGQTIVPLCPYAAQFIRDNDTYHDLLAS